MDSLIYDKAIQLLHHASTPMGFVASINEHDNYKRIWTRDGVVNGLAALLSGDKKLIETFKLTLETIFNHQHTTGFVPSNVSPDRSVSYGGLVGRADNPSWAVIGLCQYALKSDDSLARKYIAHVERCFQLMNAWEYNGKHLLYVPQSGDWADEYIQHGYILFDQLLRVWALQLAARVYARDEWKEKASEIRKVIVDNFWNYQNNEVDFYAPNIRRQLKDAPIDFWLMGFNPAQLYHQFDLQANSLALLLSLGTKNQDDGLVRYLSEALVKYNSPMPSLVPSITEKDLAMREMKDNYAFMFRNFPHEFHNGGIWPVWNGFLVAALHTKGYEDLAKNIFLSLEETVSKNNSEFNECYHGITKTPIGVPACIWSAGGIMIGYQFIKGNRLEIN